MLPYPPDMNWRTLAVVALFVVAGCVGSPLGTSEPRAGGGSTATTTTQATTTQTTTTQATQTPQNAAEQPRVTVRDRESNEKLGNVTVEVSDTRDERYTGLSEHESLGENEGMLFVYADEGEHTYVMRSMDFPIDIVYVDASGRITKIHHAPTEPDNEDLTPYPGRGKWVLEVPYNWTTERGVEEGDRVVVEGVEGA
jgi:uncharacterized membrane protein (UPF0127 family)